VQFHLVKDKQKQEKVRYVQYAPDGKTKLGLQIEYQNGNSAWVKFRTSGSAAGTIESVQFKYPLQDGQKSRQVARELGLDTDGRTYLFDRAYRQNGVLSYSAERKADKYEAFEYFDNGSSKQRHQVFIKLYGQWKLDSDEIFRVNGDLDQSVARRDDGSVITKKFSDDNKVVWRSVENSWGSGRLTDYYESDGFTTAKRVEQTGYDVTISQFKSGQIAQVIRFASGFNYLYVSVYDSAGRLRLRQFFVARTYGDVRTNGQIDLLKYRLDSIEYYNDTGSQTEEVSFFRNTNVPAAIRLPDTAYKGTSWYKPYALKTFRPDGTLSEVTTYDDANKVLTKEEHTAAENIHETIDANDLTILQFEQPPNTLQFRMPTTRYL